MTSSLSDMLNCKRPGKRKKIARIRGCPYGNSVRKIGKARSRLIAGGFNAIQFQTDRIPNEIATVARVKIVAGHPEG